LNFRDGRALRRHSRTLAHASVPSPEAYQESSRTCTPTSIGWPRLRPNGLLTGVCLQGVPLLVLPWRDRLDRVEASGRGRGGPVGVDPDGWSWPRDDADPAGLWQVPGVGFTGW
jgi:hypothetical protein